MPMLARMRLRSLLAPIDATPLGLRWGRPVSRTELDDYQRWRQEIELSADEIAVGLPALPAFEPPPAAPSRHRRPPAETDPVIVLALLGRRTVARVVWLSPWSLWRSRALLRLSTAPCGRTAPFVGPSVSRSAFGAQTVGCS
jgi:hypothetical protein